VKLIVETDILVDVALDRSPFADAAAEFLDETEPITAARP
jgi:hypothetical protein